MVAVASGFYLPIFILIIAIKKKVVQPRIGYVEHKGIYMKTRKTFTLLLILGIVLFVAATFIYLNIASGSKSYIIRNIATEFGGIIFGLIISFVLTLLAKVFLINRFYVYAVLVFLAFVAMKFINYEYIIAVPIISCGALILSIGVFIFIKFINRYPKLSESEDEE